MITETPQQQRSAGVVEHDPEGGVDDTPVINEPQKKPCYGRAVRQPAENGMQKHITTADPHAHQRSVRSILMVLVR